MAVDAAPTSRSLDESGDDDIPDTVTDTLTDTDVPAEGRSPARAAVAFGVLVVAALCVLAGWLGYSAYHHRQIAERDGRFLAVGTQAALNLTTIGYESVDTDVTRILDSSTGTFRDDFRQRAPAFVDVVKKVQSTTTGTIVAAGVESSDSDAARILVAVSVKTSTAEAKDQPVRYWRMRIDVQRDAGTVKVANVEFVP